MDPICRLTSLATLLLAAALAQAAPGDGRGVRPVAPEPAASTPLPAASAPTPLRRQRVLAPQSPAVKAAEAARIPGDVRPENPVVPQLTLPLRRDGTKSK